MKPEFHITVNTSPNIQKALAGQLDLREELSVLKTALLYGDNVTVYSLAYQLAVFFRKKLLSVSEFAFFTTEQKQEYQHLKSQNKRTSSEEEIFQEFQKVLTHNRKAKHDILRNTIHIQSFKEFQKAIKSHFVEYKGYDFDLEIFTKLDIEAGNLEEFFSNYSEEIVAFTAHYTEVLKGIIEVPQTYPLFDAYTGLTLELIATNDIELAKPVKADLKHMTLMSNVLDKLPLFESASVDVILDIRKELNTSLIHFRQAISNFSKDIESEIWDKNFEREVKQILLTEIQQAVDIIQHEVKSNKSLKPFIPIVGTSKQVDTTSGIGMLIGSATGIPIFFQALLGLVYGTANNLFEKMQTRNSEFEHIKRNQLFFYYKAGELLKNKKGRS